MTCNFKVNDSVRVSPKVCGTVIQLLPIGNDTNLMVQLPNGQTTIIPCQSASPCGAGAAKTARKRARGKLPNSAG
jgi:hypothetical protein